MAPMPSMWSQYSCRLSKRKLNVLGRSWCEARFNRDDMMNRGKKVFFSIIGNNICNRYIQKFIKK